MVYLGANQERRKRCLLGQFKTFALELTNFTLVIPTHAYNGLKGLLNSSVCSFFCLDVKVRALGPVSRKSW